MLPIKKRVKILVQPSTDEEGNLLFNKIGPLLSQYNIHEGFLVDDFLLKYLVKSSLMMRNVSFFFLNFVRGSKLPIIIDIYKRRNKTNIISFKNIPQQAWYKIPLNSIPLPLPAGEQCWLHSALE